jgi:hypothetical protein
MCETPHIVSARNVRSGAARHGTFSVMNDDLKAVWEQYVQAWDPKITPEKRKLCLQCLAPECVYTDPLKQTKGSNELEAYMREFHQQIPGGRFVTEYFLAHHGRSIARWKMLNGDDVAIGSGISYAEYDAQRRLVSMSGFFETPESPAPA